MSTRTEVINTVQVKIEVRNMVMPGARIVKSVVMKLTAPKIVESPLRVNPISHKSPPTPGLKVAVESGA
ncbi:unannotated protein [freshwater metagenome]|uniref:Unannotated protein n=1 Tax=freshwater metagenome TaxID=449393 RepID=A0A6J6E206_9ZZZZ